MGTLYIVATPIGNLDDITLRAIKVLSAVDTILVEDSRRSGKLLKHHTIDKPMKSYHDFNKEKVTPGIISSLVSGHSMALITDAGTPGIADPAFYLVRHAIKENISIIPIPGPTALISALIVSGLATDRFIFENFLPSSSAKRKRLFESFLEEKRTVIFYETPHRIVKVLKELGGVCPNMPVVIAREITKLHEEVLRGTSKHLLNHFTTHKPKGEMVVLLNAKDKKLLTLIEN